MIAENGTRAAAAEPVVDLDPGQLREHEANFRIYGDDADDSLIDSVRRHGVRQPLDVLADRKTMVSGHRRRDAAMKAGLDSVPCRILDLDPDDWVGVKRHLLLANAYREKSNEQKAAEFAAWKEIETEEARRRMLATQNNNAAKAAVENLPQQAPAETGKARDKAAEHVGWSGRTADKAAKVKEAIDAFEKAGKENRVLELRRALNVSVDSAFQILARWKREWRRRKQREKQREKSKTQDGIVNDHGVHWKETEEDRESILSDEDWVLSEAEEAEQATRKEFNAATREEQRKRAAAADVLAGQYPIDKEISSSIGKVIRGFDDRNREFPSARHARIGELLNTVLLEWTAWKQEAADEPE